MPIERQQVYEEWLVLRTQAGDAGALTELVQLYAEGFAKCARVLAARGAVDDVVQDTWLAIIRGIGRLDDPQRFRSWAYRILANKCADSVRSRVAGRAAALRESSEHRVEGTAAGDDHHAVREAVARLDEPQRTVVALFYAGGLSVSAIAAAIGVPTGTVKSRLYEARRRIGESLEPHGSGPD